MDHVSQSRADHAKEFIVIMDCFPTLHPLSMLSLDPIDCDGIESMRRDRVDAMG